MRRGCKVVFASDSLEKDFEKIKDEKIGKYLKRAFLDIEENVFCGVRIPKRLIPKEYIFKHNVDNLMKYDLPDGWRLIYTLDSEENAKILAVLLEWFNHKNYEKKFGYRVREVFMK